MLATYLFVQGQLFAPRLDPEKKTYKAGTKTNLNVGKKKKREEDGGRGR